MESLLNLPPERFLLTSSTRRSNLHLSIWASVHTKLGCYENDIFPIVLSHFLNARSEPVPRRRPQLIIYLPTRNQVMVLFFYLKARLIEAGFTPDELRLLDHMHADVDRVTRGESVQRFATQTIVMVATKAFGMGIDSPRVLLVIVYDLPSDLEDFLQKGGRAGRLWGIFAHVLLLFSSKRKLAGRKPLHPPKDPLVAASALVAQEAVARFVSCGTCLWDFLLEYFGEEHARAAQAKPLGSCCSNCDLAASNQLSVSGSQQEAVRRWRAAPVVADPSSELVPVACAVLRVVQGLVSADAGLVAGVLTRDKAATKKLAPYQVLLACLHFAISPFFALLLFCSVCRFYICVQFRV